MRRVWSLRRLRVRRDMLDLLADAGAPPRAQAAGRVLGTSQPDAPCQLVLLDAALTVVVEAGRSRGMVRIPFDQLDSFQPDPSVSGARAYQVWWGPDPLDDLRQGLAFCVERTRRGREFAAMLEAAVAARRPDLPRGNAGRAARPPMEPQEMWVAPFEPWGPGASRPPKRGTPCDRLGEVIGEVYRRAAGKPEQRVRAVLERELQAAGMRVTPAYTDELVSGLAARPGPFGRFTRRYTKRHDQAGPVDQPRHWMDAIADRLLALPGVSSANWHTCPVIGCDRTFAVTIDPWSEATMERVRRVAVPYEVSFQRPT